MTRVDETVIKNYYYVFIVLSINHAIINSFIKSYVIVIHGKFWSDDCANMCIDACWITV